MTVLTTLLPVVFLLQAGDPERTSQPTPIVLKATRLFDGKSDALVPDGMVIIEGKAIKAVGPRLMVPEGSTVIDLGDATLCPGFMDAHTHVTNELSEQSYEKFIVNGFRREVSDARSMPRSTRGGRWRPGSRPSAIWDPRTTLTSACATASRRD